MKRNTRIKQNKGITLIALVITIIVLLILAGVAIATLTGDNGILTKASGSKMKNEQATVKERIILAYGEYQIELKTSNNVKLASTEPVKARANSQTFLQYLESKEYINSEGIVNVKKLTGNKMTLGNGTGKTDVYIISLDEEENKYVLNYYDVNENETFLWETNADGNENAVKINISKTPDTEKTMGVLLKVTSVEGMLATLKSDETGYAELLQKIENMEKENKKELLKRLWIVGINKDEGTDFTTFDEVLQYMNEQGGTNLTEEDFWKMCESNWNENGITINEDIVDMIGWAFSNEETGKVKLVEIINPAGEISDTYIAKENGTYTFTVKDLITEKTYKKSVEVTNIDKTVTLSWSTYYNEIEDIYMIAPQDLFDYEIINNNEKEAKITRIKPKYANGYGYNPDTKKNDLTDTNYGIVYEGKAISDILVVPYQVEIDGELYRVTEVDLSVFGWATGDYMTGVEDALVRVETIIYPNTVKKICSSLHGSSLLKKVVLPNGLIEIPNRMFMDSNLTKINLPSSLSGIGNYAFADCKRLTSMTISENVTSIGESAFSGCSNLTSITIPDSVTSIGDHAFANNGRWDPSSMTVYLKKGSPLASNIPANKWGAKEVILID